MKSGPRVQRVGHKSSRSGPPECKEWDKRVDNFCQNGAGTFMVQNFENIILEGFTGMYFESF